MLALKVNGRIVPLDTELNTGDVVQIQTRRMAIQPRLAADCKNQQREESDKRLVQREMKDENIAKGKEMLEKEAKRQGLTSARISFILNGWNLSLKRYTFHEMDDLYAAVGCGGCIDQSRYCSADRGSQKKHKQERKAELFEKAKTSSAQRQTECQDAFAWRNCKGPRKYVGSYGTLL